MKREQEENPHAGNAGFVEGRRSTLGAWVTMYVAAEQGIDVDGNFYAVVCEKHATICGVNSKASGRPFLRLPEFCEECMKALDSEAATVAA